MKALAFEAVLAAPPPSATGARVDTVSRTIAVRQDQTLEQLHEALRLAFGWADPHLYAFWADGTFWSDDQNAGYWAPDELEEDQRSARVPVGELDIRKGRRLAYVFDFGDEWQVLLRVVDSWYAEDEAYPMLVEAQGVPPPQYGPFEDDDEGAGMEDDESRRPTRGVAEHKMSRTPASGGNSTSTRSRGAALEEHVRAR
jgi:Plasmid pRiA4b ORF-3-like protein